MIKPQSAVAAILMIAASLVVVHSPAAIAAEPRALLSSSSGEFQPARGPGFLAWEANTRAKPDRYNVYVRPNGKPRIKVNADGTNAANGGIDGDRLVYQQYRDGRSDIKFFDISSRTRNDAPAFVNTRQWEYWPSLSGDWLLFGRLGADGTRKIILFNLQTKAARTLDRVGSRSSFLAPGHVSGNYVVWHRCTPDTKCDVFRYTISTRAESKVPNAGFYQRSSSVASDGSVYFARSGRGCGSAVRLMRYRQGEGTKVLTRLPDGNDIGDTYAHTAANGNTEILYEHNVCGKPAGSDIWMVAEQPRSFALDVAVAGGSGRVASTPAGIDCGEDCHEQFAFGTSVTLTAEPLAGSVFTGWNGAPCNGTTAATCTVSVDAARSVTANFATGNTLTVAKQGTGSGSVVSSPDGIACGADCEGTFAAGTTAVLTAVPAADSSFAGWGGGACNGMTELTCSVTMDAASAVTATFNLVTAGGGTGGGGTGGGGTGGGGVTPIFHVLTISKSGTGAGTVTSGDGGINCGIDCTHSYVENSAVDLTATAGPGWVFTGWAGACTGLATTCSVAMSAARSVTATFGAPSHALTVTKDGTGTGTVTSSVAGISCGTDCDHGYAQGSSVTLTAIASTGSTFSGWTGACTGTTTTCTVTMDGAKTVNATFETVPRALTIAKNGTGSGTVSSASVGIDCGSDCSESYPSGTAVVLTAAADPGSTFTGWSSSCTPAALDPNTCTVSMTVNRTVTATFALDTFALTVSKAGTGGGSVSSSPAGITCGSDCSQNYASGTSVQLTATTSQSTFAGWSGACTGTATTCTVTMDAARTVTATFDALPLFDLNVTVTGAGSGNVTTGGSLIDCPGDCSETYEEGSSVTLTASADTGSTFTGWSGGGCTGTGTCVVTMSANKSVTANFDLAPILTFDLDVTLSGTGSGDVASTDDLIGCPSDCGETYEDGSSVTLSASADAGSTFTGWTGGGCSGTGNCVVTMTAARSVTATFDLIPTPTPTPTPTFLLDVSRTGAGTGSVTSTDGFIGCPGDCSQSYDDGSSVTLSASADTGSTFTGWSGGGCSGTGTCVVTMSTDRSVTANFDLEVVTPTATTTLFSAAYPSFLDDRGASPMSGFLIGSRDWASGPSHVGSAGSDSRSPSLWTSVTVLRFYLQLDLYRYQERNGR